jgi:hypothetical protein
MHMMCLIREPIQANGIECQQLDPWSSILTSETVLSFNRPGRLRLITNSNDEPFQYMDGLVAAPIHSKENKVAHFDVSYEFLKTVPTIADVHRHGFGQSNR